MKRTPGAGLLSTASEQFVGRLFQHAGYTDAVSASLEETDSKEQRDCPLKAHMMMTLVVVMSMFRDCSIPGVFREIVDWMRGTFPGLPFKPISDTAILKARLRLGVEPLIALFKRLWTTGAAIVPTWKGLCPYTVDAVHMLMPDSPDNVTEFGKHKSSRRGETAFPQLTVIALIATHVRKVRDFIIGDCNEPERPACEEFLVHLGPSDLLLLDRGYHAVWLFLKCLEKGVHFVCRASSSYKPKIIGVFGPGDYLVALVARIPLSPEEMQRQGKKTRRVRIVLRMVVSRVGRHKPVTILTDLFDTKAFSAIELARFYHERWECELAHDELKTHLAAVAGGTLKTTFRSITPIGVLQEVFGLFIAYNIIREFMADGASIKGVPPRYISFVESLQAIRQAIPRFEKATLEYAKRLWRRFLKDIASCELRRPRRPRCYPRVVKVKFARFPKKRPIHQQEIVDFARDMVLQDWNADVREAA